MIPRLVVASKNPDKVAEIERLLAGTGLVADVVRGLDWPDVAETGSTLGENAKLKARAVVEATGLPALADDTGLEVDALAGEPGVNSARFAGANASYADNVRKLLELMDGRLDRAARFRTVLSLGFPDGVHVVAEGVLEGVIAHEPHGHAGFGYDPVFEFGGRSLAEMSPEQKSNVSHRAIAIRVLVGELGL